MRMLKQLDRQTHTDAQDDYHNLVYVRQGYGTAGIKYCLHITLTLCNEVRELKWELRKESLALCDQHSPVERKL